jgi:hypothetical protein
LILIAFASALYYNHMLINETIKERGRDNYA